jgi:hypothetical protein
LELKTLVLSAKENCNWISNVIRRGALILCSMLKLMNFFPELIHIAAHLPKVVLRVAEGSTEKEEEED